MTDAFSDLRDSADELASEEAALAALDRAEAVDPVPDPETVEPLLPEKGVTVGLHRLLARAQAEADDPDAADQTLLALAERLNQAHYWTALARVAAILLDRHPHQAAPLLARARREGGTAAVDDDLLEDAHRALPRHALLGWLAAEARQARGDGAGARRAAADALPELLEDKNYDVAEEALLLLADEDAGPAVSRALIRSLEILARQEAWTRLDTVLDLGAPHLSSRRAAPLAWPVLKELWRRHPERDSLRNAVAAVTRTLASGYPEPEAIVRISEIERPSQSAEVVLDRLAKAMKFPPGYYARHMGWGVGRIRDNDTEALIVDFPNKPMHRMTLATAEKALDPLPPDDLRVLLSVDPERVKGMLRDDPGGVVVLALRTLRDGQGAADDLRKVLVPAVLPSSSWAGWWRRAREAAAADPRVDARRAYENVFRLAGDGDDESEVELPVWNVKRDPLKNLGLLDTFLSHYPDQAPRVLKAYGDRVETLTSDRRRPAEVRAAAALWLLRVDPASDARPEDEVGPGFDVNVLSKAEQEVLLDRLEGTEALAVAMDTRATSIRRRVWERLGEMDAREAAARLVLDDGARHPEAALHVLEEGLDDAGFAALTPEWSAILLGGWIDLLERPRRETHQKRALALMKVDSALARRLIAAPIPEDDQAPFTVRLKRWQGTDRVRFPLLEFLSATGHGEISEEVEGHRVRSAARLGNRMAAETEDPYDGDLVVTRATLSRLEKEHTRVGMELKTVIPQAIQKAREHGDLRENAEYKAAKDKQATYAQRFEELETHLKRVRLIEDLDRKAGVALPGTEISLEAVDEEGGETVVFWLLGEGDQDLGPEVVSYKAPVGKALFGRRLGDTVDVPREGGSRRFRILGITERLP